MEKRVTRIKPAECGEKKKCIFSQLLVRQLKMLAYRENAVLTDQSVDLKPERDESDQVNGAERANKQVAALEVSRAANVVAP